MSPADKVTGSLRPREARENEHAMICVRFSTSRHLLTLLTYRHLQSRRRWGRLIGRDLASVFGLVW